MKHPIAFMDSGLGGISVMAEARKLLPYEDFIMYGDSLNAPYGEKSDEEIISLAMKAAEKLLKYNIKALVIACNTATSVAGDMLKAKMPVPVVGIAPPLLEAQKLRKSGQILVMMTSSAAKSSSIENMMAHYGKNAVLIPCPGLMEFAEKGELESEGLNNALKNLLNPYLKVKTDVVILGCTHYPFLQKSIGSFFPEDTLFISGSAKTARDLNQILDKENAFAKDKVLGKTLFMNSLESKLPLMKKLYLSFGFDEEEII
ncbi:MAG: glutamate racemase [Christensenellales bacterium]